MKNELSSNLVEGRAPPLGPRSEIASEFTRVPFYPCLSRKINKDRRYSRGVGTIDHAPDRTSPITE